MDNIKNMMKNKWNLVIILLLGILLNACAARSSYFIKRSDFDKIVDGKTTLTDMKSLFGDYLSEEIRDDGTKLRTWIYGETGAFGVSEYRVTIHAWFNKNDIVVRHNTRDKCYDLSSNMCNEGKYAK